ncbi:DUF3971 domain-containing protein [Acidibrevibacterium fodinaquatile]|uniref:DUF3971 domain-containing protein n=1 Tax=Acidibrevibacterium fodinaquatile TaxID=1969806 RepID=UPI0013B3C16A|nr:DUF3971 domain-containing protein [Acidibrevibacterium fodinaquatile]
MKALRGQASLAYVWRRRHWLRPAWWALHRLAALTLALAMLASLALGAGFWRLTEGPINLAWLARQLEAVANRGAHPIVLHIGQAALVWEGFRGGVDRPIDLRLADLVATDRAGHAIAEIPRAEVSLALHALLLGRLAPRAADLDIERLRLVRGQDGALSLFADNAPRATTPAASLIFASGIDLTDLRRIRLASREITIADQALGLIWRIDGAEAVLDRRADEGFAGDVAAKLVAAGQTLPLRARITLAERGAAPILVAATLGPITPAALADAAPAFAPLRAIAAPLGADITLRLDRDFAWRGLAGAFTLGPGHLALAGGAIPLLAAQGTISATDHDHLLLHALSATLAAPDHGAGPTLHAEGVLSRAAAGRVALALDARLDRVAFADLARYWPPGLAPDTRDWLTTNITEGSAHDGHLTLTASADPDGGAPRLEAISGQLAGDDLAITWLAPLPPLRHASATLTIAAPDALSIAARSGEVAMPGGGAIQLTAGNLEIAGLDAADQTAAMHMTLAGQVADALALLGQKRLHLFDPRKLPFSEPGGTFSADLAVALPLAREVKSDDVTVSANATLHDLRLRGIAAGRDLTEGEATLTVDQAGLHGDGTAQLAGVPTKLGVRLDFTAGPPSQEVTEVALRARLGAADFARLGLDPGGRLSGAIPLDAEWIERRDGAALIALTADLTPADLAPVPLGWRKPAGVSGHLAADLRFDHGRLAGIDHIVLQSQDAAILASADTANGAPWHLVIARGDLGATHVHGDLLFPAASDAPYRLRLSGPSLDLSGRRPPSPADHPARAARRAETRVTAPDTPGAPWQVSAAFDTVLLGPGRRLGFLNLSAEDDGRRLTALNAEGFDRGGGARGNFRLAITPAANGERRVSAHAEDAGALFASIAGITTLAGGRLSFAGRFDDHKAGHPLDGTLEITGFSLRDAPLTMRVLQGMTVYGLLGQQPGRSLAFDRLVAPLTYQDGLVSLANARMSNASLGFTAKGTIDLETRFVDLAGTVVPAYFFNSLLGRIPLLGRLFSPERGGGVLAASYAASGPFDDPKVSVNPLSALTPGFTRDIFNLFNSNQ